MRFVRRDFMAVVQCSNAHYYDNEKYSACPHCAAMTDAGKPEGAAAAALEAQQIGNCAAAYVKQNLQHVQKGNMEKELEKEHAAAGSAQRCTAGWLVCVSGADYGRDFPLYAGFNRIGRDKACDIVLADVQVSREEHCSVIYEEKKNVFYLFPKAGALSYIGDELVQEAVEIFHGGIITVGNTQLELAAFCMGEKRWIKNG